MRAIRWTRREPFPLAVCYTLTDKAWGHHILESLCFSIMAPSATTCYHLHRLHTRSTQVICISTRPGKCRGTWLVHKIRWRRRSPARPYNKRCLCVSVWVTLCPDAWPWHQLIWPHFPFPYLTPATSHHQTHLPISHLIHEGIHLPLKKAYWKDYSMRECEDVKSDMYGIGHIRTDIPLRYWLNLSPVRHTANVPIWLYKIIGRRNIERKG